MSFRQDLYRAVYEHAAQRKEDSTLGPRNFRDFCRQLGYSDRDFDRIRHQQSDVFEVDGLLHELVEFREGKPPLIYVEPAEKFSRRKQAPWENRIAVAGYVCETTVPEPTAVKDDGLNMQIAMIDRVKLPGFTEYPRIARLVMAQMDRAGATQVLALLHGLGEMASRSVLQESQLSDVKDHLRTEKERVNDLKMIGMAGRPPVRGNHPVDEQPHTSPLPH